MDWSFSIIDKMSGPAEKIRSALTGVVSSLDKVKEHSEHTEHGVQHDFKEFGEQMFKALTWAKLLEKGFEELKEGITEGLHFAAEAASFKEDAMVGLSAILRSRKMASEVIEQAEGLANGLGLDSKAVVRAYQDLALAKVKPINIPVLIQAAGDLAALSGHPESFNEVANAFKRMSAEGSLTTFAVRGLKNSGLDVEALYKRLGVQFNTNTQGVKKMMEAGKISAADGIKAIVETIGAQGGGKVGGIAKELGGGLEGSITKAKNAMEQLLSGVGESKGFAQLINGFQKFAEAIGPGSVAGERILKVANTAFGMLGAVIDALVKNAGGVVTIFEVVAGALEFVARAIYTVIAGWGEFIAFGSQLGTFFSDIGNGIKFEVVGAFYSLLEVGRNLWNSFKDIGARLMQGLVDGIMGAFDTVGDAIGHVASNVVLKMKSVLGIASPSKVFAELGKNTALGFKVGIEGQRTGDMLNREFKAGGPSSGSTASQGGRGSSNVSMGGVNVEIIVNGAHSPEETANDVAKKLKEILGGDLVSAHDKLAIQGGFA